MSGDWEGEGVKGERWGGEERGGEEHGRRAWEGEMRCTRKSDREGRKERLGGV